MHMSRDVVDCSGRESECSMTDDVSYSIDGSKLFVADGDDAHDVCLSFLQILSTARRLLFGEEALPLALPTIVITVR